MVLIRIDLSLLNTTALDLLFYFLFVRCNFCAFVGTCKPAFTLNLVQFITIYFLTRYNALY